MDLREAIVGRRSVRAFTGAPVRPEAVHALKEALRWAPSAGNLQARRFWFVANAAARARLAASSLQPEVFAKAALVVVGATDDRIAEKYGERGRGLYAVQDVAAAVENLLLAAHAQGLGALWVGAFDPAAVREALSLPAAFEPVVLVPVGTPAEDPPPPPRLPDDRLFVDVP